jgi:quercetin dioxygenase-like cupin family protein
MHPRGAELVACIEGAMTLHQEIDGETRAAVLSAGEAIVNAPGVWHTADIDDRAMAFFVTAGAGTVHRPR